MDRDTVAIYEERAAEWRARRTPTLRPDARTLAARRLPGRPLVDLGCGPGSYLPDLGAPTVGLDAAHAMLVLARQAIPKTLVVQGDLGSLPFRRAALGAAWARNSYVHIPKAQLPLALARLHDALAVGAPVELTFIAGDGEGAFPNDDFPGRFFALWRPDTLVSVAEGAGFAVDDVVEHRDRISVIGTRDRTLPDFVASGMQVLVCGLNPSVVAADAGYGYAGPSNRFWKAALASGLVSHPRDPWRVLTDDGVGMTDFVKRATPRASELDKREYRDGALRVGRLVEWLQPALVLFVGLEGWRAAVDRRAAPGRQPNGFGGAAAYVMPSTSGLNAHTQLDGLVEHMRAALAIASAARSRRSGPGASSSRTSRPRSSAPRR